MKISKEFLKGHEVFLEKRDANKRMYKSIKLLAESTGIEEKILHLAKDIYHYEGRGYVNVLDRVSGVEYPDRVAPTFNRLGKILQAMQSMNDYEIINKYCDAFRDKYGIKITIEEPVSKQSADAGAAIRDISEENLTEVCELNDTLNDIKKDLSDMDICPKRDFNDSIRIYDNKVSGRVDKALDKAAKVIKTCKLGALQVSDIVEENHGE